MRNNFSLNLPSKIPVCSCAMCQGNSNIRLPKAAPSNSGDYQIDAINSGYRWQNPATLTYSFFTNGSSYYGSESVSEVSATIKSSVRTILEQIIEPLINVNFVEVSDSSSSYGKLRFMFSNGPGYAYAYYPYSETAPIAGDVHLSPNYENSSNNAFSSGPGNHGFATLIHEIGHALGLKHTGNYYSGQEPGPYLPFAEDNTINTVMSYNFPSRAPGNLMPYDVKALQYLYGAKAKNPGDTTYTFNNVYRYTTGTETNGNTSSGVKIAIVDSGGVDTLDFSQLPFISSGYRFDLGENGLITESRVYNAQSYTPYNNSSAGTFYTSTYGTRISFTSLENLINSSSNDYIIAGNAANTFSGYSPSISTGNDTIEGANNLDVLNLSSFNSSNVTQTQNGNNLILGLGTNRTINVKDYYLAPQGSRLQIQFAAPGTIPDITIDNISVTEGQTGTKDANFNVSLSNSSTSTVTVLYATANDTASAASDYLGIPTTVLTFNPGETSKIISVSVNGDSLVEPNETFFVNLANATNANIADNQGIGTIINDDLPSIVINDVSVTERNTQPTSANFVVSLSSSSTLPVTVQYATANGTASAGSDYNEIAATILTFNPGETRKTFSVGVNGDTIVEQNETFFVNLTSPNNAAIADNQGIGTIINDDLPIVSINDVSVVEGASGLNYANFIVGLNASSTTAVTVNYTTQNGTALSGSDYVGTTAILSFSPGQTITTISVAVNGDTLAEPNERFFVNLTSSTNSIIGEGFGIGTILNDDNLPSISISDTNVTEGNSGTTTANFIVSLNNSNVNPVTVNYASANSSASAGSDYQAISATPLTFNPGETLKTISVSVNGDTQAEANERFFVNLTNPLNGTILDSQGVGTILNDDNPPRISISDTTVTEGNSGITMANFTVSLNNSSVTPVTVNYASANSSASAGSDYQAISATPLTFNPGETLKTISVAVNGDTQAEANERFFVNLTNPLNGTIFDGQGVGTILNDDNPPRISISDTNVTEGNSGTTTANFIVSLNNSSVTPVTVNYATATNSSASAGSDYQAISATPLTFNPGETLKTISVAVNGDTQAEANERFFVNLTNPLNGTIFDGQGVGTILNDDNLPRISITDSTVTEGNSGVTMANFTVSLSNSTSATVTLRFSTANGNALSMSDYVLTTGSLTFNPGETTKTIAVQVNGDTAIEANERFLVNLTNVSGGTFLDNQAVGAILNDDVANSKPQSQNLLGKVKTLTGSDGSDVFTLENDTVSVIQAFEPNQDLIKLSGKESDFTTKSGNFGLGLPAGVGIFYKGDQLIALVSDVSQVSLTSNSFEYVV